MKKLNKLIGIGMVIGIACLSLMACSEPAPYQVDDAKQPALQLLDGKSKHLNDYRGKWVYINYWASWCQPCVREIPLLNDIAKEYAGNVVVLAMNYDKPEKEALVDLVKQANIHYASLLEDPQPRLGIDEVEGLPTTVVINPEGWVVKKFVGEQSKERFLNIMEKEG